jgi:hypothetical protein
MLAPFRMTRSFFFKAVLTAFVMSETVHAFTGWIRGRMATTPRGSESHLPVSYAQRHSVRIMRRSLATVVMETEFILERR